MKWGDYLPSMDDEIETKRGNYLFLNPLEANAIKYYTGHGSVWMNMLFNTDIGIVLPRLRRWARADEMVDGALKKDDVDKIIYLYSALLKAQDWHNSPFDAEEHPGTLYRGSRGNTDSDGFQSFTRKEAMAECFGSTIFIIKVPKDIPYLSEDDIFNYATHSSRREEQEYLFPPFCEYKSIYENPNLLGFRSKRDHYHLSKTNITYSLDNLPADINVNLTQMGKLIARYRTVLYSQEHFKIHNALDDPRYLALANERDEISNSYKILSEQVLNYINFNCAEVERNHVINPQLTPEVYDRGSAEHVPPKNSPNPPVKRKLL